MRLELILDEILQVLDDADIGLNVPSADERGGVRGGVPAPYVQLPEITYGEGGRGLDRLLDLGLMVIFGPADNVQVFRSALEHASSGGEKSIKVLLEQHTYTTLGTLFVKSAEPSVETERAGNPAIAYTFHIDITGRPG